MKNIIFFYYNNPIIYKLRQIYGSVASFIADPINWPKKMMRLREENQLLNKNINLRDKHKGEKCFILGNGRSLNKININKLRSNHIFVVNNFIVHPDLDIIRPRFYVNIEPLSLLKNKGRNSYYHPDNYYKLIDRKLKKHDTILFFHSDSQEYIESHKLFKNKHVYYLSTKCSVFDAEKYGYEDDLTKPITFNDSVVSSAICIANYMGFNPAFILGCDEDAFKLMRVEHFYKFPPAKIIRLSQAEVEREHDRDRQRWQLINNYFLKAGLKIYNAGIQGYLEAFPRIKYNEALRSKN